ncbi:uncharacterized protein [Miscanthus floridulus]|uniref:uncharacterized protein n=1 Tax=Miscanthus floridulus TaxID=154761 RepID=UPI00345AEDD4
MLKGQNISREAILRYKLEKLEDQKELYWRQKAHVHWLQEGDRNTKFFHQYASDRKRMNRIKKLVKDDGGARFEELLNQVHQRVTTDMNNYLMEEYGDEEIKQALDSIGDLTAPGVDDNVLLAYEMTHFMKTKKREPDSYAAVKLVMSKAYDRVEWFFLEKMLLKLGFHTGWVQIIMNCVPTVTYRIKVNGLPKGITLLEFETEEEENQEAP